MQNKITKALFVGFFVCFILFPIFFYEMDILPIIFFASCLYGVFINILIFINHLTKANNRYLKSIWVLSFFICAIATIKATIPLNEDLLIFFEGYIVMIFSAPIGFLFAYLPFFEMSRIFQIVFIVFMTFSFGYFQWFYLLPKIVKKLSTCKEI